MGERYYFPKNHLQRKWGKTNADVGQGNLCNLAFFPCWPQNTVVCCACPGMLHCGMLFPQTLQLLKPFERKNTSV